MKRFRAYFCATLLWITAVGLLGASNAWGDVRLPALVSNGMVLQRDAKILLWGWADPGEEVRIAFQGAQVKIRTDRKGRWSTSLGPYAAGGPYSMTVAGKNKLVLHDILIGDVWLASGQSNMEWPLKSPVGFINNADREIAGANFPHIRLFVVKHDAALKPKTDVDSDGWHAVSPENVGEFSAVAYLFGRELHERYRIPIGLIQSAWGGTVAEAWTSEAGLQRFPEFHSAIEALAHVNETTRADYDRYVQQKATWYQQHGSEDYGRVGRRDVWADPKFDASHWPTISLPREWAACGKDLNGFAGVVWFRRVITVPSERAGKDLVLHLGKWVVQHDVTYFNGEKIGETQEMGKPRDYWVPGKYVQSGQNTITVRLVGANYPDRSCTGMFGPDDQMSADIGTATISLAGAWSYQSGPDLRDFPVADAATLAAHPSPNVPTVLFNGMINPLVPFRLKGAIWYQGESNANRNRSAQYRTLFPALIQDWRRHWGYEFLFLFVQLAGFGPNKPEPAEYPWAELREAQSMALALPNTGMATAIDIGEEDDIHPKNKQDVAHRLALAAAKVAYGEDIVHSGPMYQAMQIEGDRIRIRFSYLGSGLLIKDKYGYVRGFEIAAADGKFHWAQARQDGQDIVVFNESIQHPVALRYNWSNTPDGSVFNQEGLPAVPFRTDARIG